MLNRAAGSRGSSCSRPRAVAVHGLHVPPSIGMVARPCSSFSAVSNCRAAQPTAYRLGRRGAKLHCGRGWRQQVKRASEFILAYWPRWRDVRDERPCGSRQRTILEWLRRHGWVSALGRRNIGLAGDGSLASSETSTTAANHMNDPGTLQCHPPKECWSLLHALASSSSQTTADIPCHTQWQYMTSNRSSRRQY